MEAGTTSGGRQVLNVAAILALWLAVALGTLVADTAGTGENPSTRLGVNDPAARFRGPLSYDFGVTNVKWEAGTEAYSFVTFDLSWSYSWRVKWVEPAKTSSTGKDIEIENWDAAWVFVKFLAEPDTPMNYWRHASLANEAALHLMPAGATNTLRLSDDGSRGIGVFIYRDAIGHGANDWKGVRLRWQHGADRVDPTKARIAVHPIAMVYVPEGPFKVGTVGESGFSPFSDGPDMPIARYDGEQSFKQLPHGLTNVIETTTRTDGGPYLRWDVNPPHVSAITHLTDGGWRGGLMIPFLVDAAWNAPHKAGTTARGIGPVAGQLWSTHTFSERGGGGGWFSSHIGGVGPLNDDYPTGYEAFYCMKYPLTQGQYVDFLNSLAPDVAAGRAFVSGEISTTAGGMHVHELNVDQGPGFQPLSVKELGGITITSSADAREKIPLEAAASDGTEEQQKGSDSMVEGLLNDLPEKRKQKNEMNTVTSQQRPVYSARCPFRRIIGIDGADTRAYAVWAGLRPMTMLENVKASVGPRDPTAPDDTAATRPDLEGAPVMLDFGLPTERFAKGDSHYSADLATRVGCRASPTSDRGAALATYWGISELSGPAIPLENRKYRGTHGGGTMPNGTPGASTQRRLAEFTAIPEDWPVWGRYGGHRHVSLKCQLVASVSHKAKAGKSAGNVGEKSAQAQTDEDPPVVQPSSRAPNVKRVDIPRVTNVKWVAGTKDYSTVTFDLAWAHSWRTQWVEPAEKNVTGKPLTVESWDAAWVFVKFREADAIDDSHATLSAQAAEHSVPAGAALNVGLDDNGNAGIGVFIYRSAPGVGANNFNGIKLRWQHGDKIDPGKGECKVHALPMVYVPDGAFASRSPWGHPLKIITTPDARKPEGHLDSDPSTVPLCAEWPNGYTAFYCMKYSISQGQYADFLNSIPSRNYNNGRYGLLAHNNVRRFSDKLYNVLGYTITTNEAGVFSADVPDRLCKLLSNPDILSFTAWAGLRPLSNLEYEKACRGPRAVLRGADAWAPATCAPAAALDKSVLDAPTAAGIGPSYWGIRELSLSGCIQEWPCVLHREPAVVKKPRIDRNAGGQKSDEQSAEEEERLAKDQENRQNKEYRGGHGSGSPDIPANWPATFFGDWYYGGIWRLWGYGTVAQWVDPAEIGRFKWDLVDGSRAGRYGARAVRTAPPLDDQESLLDINPPPAMAGYDMAVVNLSGKFRNVGDKPLKVELASALPASSFLQGAASRGFSAVAKGVTTFKIPLVLTRTLTSVTERGRQGLYLPVQIKGPGGETLGEAKILFPSDVLTRQSGAIQSLDGGIIGLKVKNATESAVTLAFEMPSLPAVRIGESKQTLTVSAGGEAVAAFRVPRQWFPQEGPCRIPYRVTIGSGAALPFETSVALQTQSRWWIRRPIQAEAKMAGDGDDSMKLLEGMSGGVLSEAGDVFTLASPSKGWTSVTGGSTVTLGKAGPLKAMDSKVIGATRAIATGDADAILDVRAVNADGVEMSLDPPKEGAAAFFLSAWVNDKLAFDSRQQKEKRSKPIRLLKGANTVVVEWRSNRAGETKAEGVRVQFNNATTGKPVPDVLFDMDQK